MTYDAPVAVPSPKLSGAECVALCCQLNDDKRKEVVQEFTALYPHWKSIEVEVAVSKYMLIAGGLAIDHPVFETPFFNDLPQDFSLSDFLL